MNMISHRLPRTRRVHWTAAIGLAVGVAFGGRTALADQAPKSLTNPEIVPVYWNGAGINVVTPEVTAVLPSFYADFTGKLLPFGLTSPFNWPNAPQNATQFLGEYGVQAFTLDNPYTVHIAAGAPATVDNNVISSMLTKEFLQGGLKAPQCNTPSTGTTAYSQMLYVIHLPPGSTFSGNSATCDQTNDKEGYHDGSFSVPFGPNRAYTCNFSIAAVLDLSPGNGNGCDKSVESTLTANGVDFGMINAYTYLLSHELAEGIVDPFGQTLEVADKCQSNRGGITNIAAPWNTLPSNSGPPWVIASTYSAKNNTCWVGEQSLYDTNNGFVSITNSSMPSWGWDAEAYKSSGFAMARGPTHMDVFNVDSFEGVASAGFYSWDTAFAGQSGPGGWKLIHNGWGTREPLDLGTGGVAPASAPITAVSLSPSSVYAFVAGNDKSIYVASCAGGDGCRTTGSWTSMAHYQMFSGSYQIAPGTPISAVATPDQSVALFFADVNGAILEIKGPILPIVTQVAPPNTVPIAAQNSNGRSYVSAMARWEVLLNKYVYEVFAADTNGHVHVWGAPASGGSWTDTAINNNVPVQPGTQIATLTRVPGQMDIFAVDASGAVQSFWWNELLTPPWQTVSPALMPAGSTLPGAGIAAVGWANEMEVFTTIAGGFLEGLWQQRFDQNQGWLASPNEWISSFTPGVQLQAVSRTRDSVDVFGLEGAGTEGAGSVDWYGFSTQFVGLTFTGDCSTTTDCYGSVVKP